MHQLECVIGIGKSFIGIGKSSGRIDLIRIFEGAMVGRERGEKGGREGGREGGRGGRERGREDGRRKLEEMVMCPALRTICASTKHP